MRTTSAVMTSPGRISVRCSDSSNRAAKDSDMIFLVRRQVYGSGIAIVCVKLTAAVLRGCVVERTRPVRVRRGEGRVSRVRACQAAAVRRLRPEGLRCPATSPTPDQPIASIVKSELSSSWASSAGLRGATLRDESRASRASRSARRLSSVVEIPFEINCLWRRSARCCGAGGQKDLERGVRERSRCPCRARRPPGQAGGEKPCCKRHQRRAHGGQGGHPRGVHAGLLRCGWPRSRPSPSSSTWSPAKCDRQTAGPARRWLLRCRASSAMPARSGGQRGDAVQRARVQEVVAQLARPARAASVPLPEAVGPSTQMTGMRAGVSLGQREQRFEVVGEGLGHALRVFDAHRQARRVEGGQRKAHGHAVVVVGVDAGGRPVCAGEAGGVTRMKSAPSSTVAPSLRSSRAMAAMRSVSLTRQLAMLRSVVVPSAYSAITASVIAASGMWLQSRSMALQRPGAARHLQPVGAAGDPRAHRLRGVDEADVALDRVRADALDPDAAVALGRGGAIAPSAMK